MKEKVVYIHGKGGNADEAAHYAPLFPDAEVIGFDYAAQTPWAARAEFAAYFSGVSEGPVTIVANSIGAYFAMHALDERTVKEAYFISPVVDMEKLIAGMMRAAGVTEAELSERGEIPTPFGEVLSWEYLAYVRKTPVTWRVPTHILYGENDALTDLETVSAFAQGHGASLTVMPGGEHWFHTEEEMRFLDGWLTGAGRG